MYTFTDNTTRDYFCQHTCEHYKNVTINFMLDQAPCPPVWKTSLFWSHPKLTGLSTSELDYVVKRCGIPLDGERQRCNVVCAILISCGVLVVCCLVLLLANRYYRLKMREKVKCESSSDLSSRGSSENGTSSTKDLYIETNGNKPSVRYDHAHDNVAFDQSNDDEPNNKVDDADNQTLPRDEFDESNNDDSKTDMTGTITDTVGKLQNVTSVT